MFNIKKTVKFKIVIYYMPLIIYTAMEMSISLTDGILNMIHTICTYHS